MNAVRQAPLKEKIRGPNLAAVIPMAEGIRMVEAIMKADRFGFVLPPNKRLDRALVGSDEWKEIAHVFSCWTGTMAAYDEPNSRLRKTIECTDAIAGIRYVFPVPGRYQGMANVVLVTEHPDFTLEQKGNTVIVNAWKVGIVAEFPVNSERWYRTDKEHGIPQGGIVSYTDPGSRHLWRIARNIGLIVRDCSFTVDDGRRFVSMNSRPSCDLGMVVEAPEKIEDIE